jgi:hypothetical protein
MLKVARVPFAYAYIEKNAAIPFLTYLLNVKRISGACSCRLGNNRGSRSELGGSQEGLGLSWRKSCSELAPPSSRCTRLVNLYFYDGETYKATGHLSAVVFPRFRLLLRLTAPPRRRFPVRRSRSTRSNGAFTQLDIT